MKILVVDDEKNVRLTLVGLLNSFCEGISEIKEADDVESGITLIESFKPDLLFLDVELKTQTGMELLNAIHDPNFELVFVTAHQQYAIDAFKFSAIDFLLKPIDPFALTQTVKKVQQNLSKNHLAEQLKILQQHHSNSKLLDNKIVLKDSEAIYYVKIANILFCAADGAYTTFHLHSGEQIIISKTIKEYDDLLTAYNFIRAHKSYLVNSYFIKKFDKTYNNIILDNDQEIPVSIRKREHVLSLLQKI